METLAQVGSAAALVLVVYFLFRASRGTRHGDIGAGDIYRASPPKYERDVRRLQNGRLVIGEKRG